MIIPPCARLYLISVLSLSWSLFGACSGFVALTQHPASDLFGEDCFLRLSQIWHYCILLALTLSPQVPTKKAKLGESLLQIMDDEDPLDKYLVRNLSFPKPTFCLWTLTSALSKLRCTFEMIIYISKSCISFSHSFLKLPDFPSVYSVVCYRPW